jgi:hypothetical protein
VSTPTGPLTDLTLTFQYGNPFGSSWEPIVQASVRYAVALRAPGASSDSSLLFRIEGLWPLSSLAAGATLAPPIWPIQGLTINGADAFQPRNATGTEPVVAWVEPATGTPSAYRVELWSVTNDNGNTALNRLASVLTADTRLEIPPQVLQAGQSYVVVVAAVLESGADLIEKPNSLSGTGGSAATVSAVMSP